MPLMREFMHYLTQPDRHDGGIIFRYVYPERIGDVIILHVPESCEQEPPDAERIKGSDYWLMKEAHSAP